MRQDIPSSILFNLLKLSTLLHPIIVVDEGGRVGDVVSALISELLPCTSLGELFFTMSGTFDSVSGLLFSSSFLLLVGEVMVFAAFGVLRTQCATQQLRADNTLACTLLLKMRNWGMFFSLLHTTNQ
jgi:hypothetical protein